MIIFDTDMSLGTPGAEIDDGAALIVLLRALGEQVAAITTNPCYAFIRITSIYSRESS